MGLTLISGMSAPQQAGDPPTTSGQATSGQATGTPTTGDVEAEARRRLAVLGYDRYRARRAATGTDMPTAVKVKHLQIMAVALALGRLPAIPHDYRSDVYWPA